MKKSLITLSVIFLSTTFLWSQENPPTPPDNKNWISSASYDLNGNTISKGVGYFNTLGKAAQSQSWDLLTDSIWTSQTMYDYHGRPALQTLSAPTGKVFSYQNSFIRNSGGNPYSVTDFDINKENPSQVSSNIDGTLGWYYSDSNNHEIYQDVTSYPFSRSIYSKLNPGTVLKSIGGNKVNINGADQWPQGYSFSMPVAQELHYAFGTDHFPRVKISEGLCTWPPYISNTEYMYDLVQMNIDDCSFIGSTIYNVMLNEGEFEYELNKIYKITLYNSSNQTYPDEAYYKIVNRTAGINYNYTLDGSVSCGPYTTCSDVYISADYIKATKTVMRDVHGIETVVFTDSDGNTLAAARSGNEDNPTQKKYQVLSPIGEQGFVDIHIPVGCGGDITFVGNPNADYYIYDLITEVILNNGNPITTNTFPLNPGMYRIVESANTVYSKNPLPYAKVNGASVELIDNINQIGVTYFVNYYDYSLNFYDKAGRLTQSVQPKGFDNALNLTTPTRNHTLTSTFNYNTLGQLQSTNSPDEGSAEFKYRKDGQIRYSQNTLQASNNEFSYTNYDNLGRPEESGVLQSTAFSSADPEGNLPSGTKKEQQFTTYDFLQSTDITFLTAFNSSYSNPTFLAGNVAKTSNNSTTTYYSYDVYGRVKWLVQNITGLGTKTIDYEYDFVTGAVTKVIYQKYNSSDMFVHKYNYNIASQLVSVETSTDNINFTEQESYTYYETGALKRKELLGGIQGTDYVYNLNGQLKAINHPSLSSDKDPGGDNDDAFGMLIDYNQNDYSRAQRSNITTTPFGTDQFNGNIKTTRWNTFGNALPNPKENAYNYQYNKNNWLQSATYGELVTNGNNTNGNVVSNLTSTDDISSGTVNLEATNSITLLPGFRAYGSSNVTAKIVSLTGFDQKNGGDYNVSEITYDANGNIITLIRNKNTENGSNAMDDFTYNYKTGKNQLDYVADAVTTPTNADDLKNQTTGNYTYNSIGQLIQSNENGVVINYLYNTSGLVTEIKKNTVTLVKFFYNDKGHRVKKEIYSSGGSLTDTDYYVRDAAGSVMAIYRNNTLTEQPIYGSSRIGVYKRADNSSMYQLTDHLGNVRAVIGKDGSNNMVMLSYTDYYPFGMPMPNRNVEGDYRYGYQGEFAEKESELPGRNSFELRLYDSRIGRWISPDPYGQYNSPYLGMGNRPNMLVDPDGGCTDDKGNPCTYTNGSATDLAGNSWSMVDGTEVLNTPIPLGEAVIVGSSSGGITAMDVTRTVADFTPGVGAIWDITEGVQNGNGWQVAAGVGFLVLDVATLGGSSIVKGTLKTAVKQGIKQTAKRTALKTTINTARGKAVRSAWKQEKALFETTGQGTRDWTESEAKELLTNGKVSGYHGHHINNVKHHPNQAGDASNIEFLTRKEHLKAHGGNWKNKTTGELIDRGF